MNFKAFINEMGHEFISVYHVSPRSDMSRLRATSPRKGTRAYIGKGESGIFVAPKFKDAVAWATSYVGGKKHHTQKPNERLKEKGGGYHGEKFKGIYRDLTIYEIKVPKEVLKRSVYTGWWEPEYFIAADDMDKMIIVSSKTYSFYELAAMQSRFDRIRTEFYPQGNRNIKDVSKTNLAARYYLELKDLYAKSLLGGASPVIASDDSTSHRGSSHLIDREIEKLKKYIFKNNPDFSVEKINFLDRKQEGEVREIYKRIKSLIETL